MTWWRTAAWWAASSRCRSHRRIVPGCGRAATAGLLRSGCLSAYRLLDEKIDCGAAIEPLCHPARLMNWSSWGDGDVSSWQSVWAEHLAIRGLPLGRNRRDRRWSLRGLFLHSFLVDAANRDCEFRARRISAATQDDREI